MARKAKTITDISEIQLPDYLAESNIISTNIVEIDTLLNGGLHEAITQLVGETQTGKTAIALQITYNLCNYDKVVVYVDAKGDIDKNRLDKIGLTKYLNTKFFYIKGYVFTEIEKLLDQFIQTGQVDLIVIDSLPSLINNCYLNIEGKHLSVDNHNTSATTRPLMLLVQKLKKLSMKYHFSLLLINEFRQKVDKRIGTLPKIYGPKALEYESNYIIKVKPITSGVNKTFKSKLEALENSEIGMCAELVLLKGGKSNIPVTIPIFIKNGVGIKFAYWVLFHFLDTNCIAQSGAYYSFGNINTRGLSDFSLRFFKDASYEQMQDNTIKYVSENYPISVKK